MLNILNLNIQYKITNHNIIINFFNGFKDKVGLSVRPETYRSLFANEIQLL